MNQLPRFQLFGSEDSADIDVVFLLNELPISIIESSTLCKQLTFDYEKMYSIERKVNANIAIVADGIVKDTFKGNIDELNNALFYTYDDHKQMYENCITRLLTRDVDLKFLRSTRIILSLLTKTKMRHDIKNCLEKGIDQKLTVLKKVNLLEIDDFGVKMDKIEVIKSIAFQVGQSLLLESAIEVYSKREIGEKLPKLNTYLQRDDVPLSDLQQYLEKFASVLDKRIPDMISKFEYKYLNKK